MRKSPQSGFSLIEVLVALSITSLCVGLVTLSLGGVFRAQERARAHMELQQIGSESMERIRGLIQAAYISRDSPWLTPFEAMDIDNLSEPYDAITFTTLAHNSHKINAKEANIIEITLFTVDEPPLETVDGGRLRLNRLRIRAGGEINSRFEVEGGSVYTLADHVTRFHLEYLDQFGEWKTEWEGVTLPCAIWIELGVRTESLEEEVSSLIIPMEMTNLECRFEDERIFER